MLSFDKRIFNRAIQKSGIEPFRFHDLRHSWASLHVKNKTPLLVLQKLGGWETLAMVNRYAHVSSDLLAEYAIEFKD